MPELAEVEFYRRQWNPGMGSKVQEVLLHPRTRVFRNTPADRLARELTRARLAASEARAKQMLFRFSGGRWLGVHLGMTGQLRVEGPRHLPGPHDHLVLRQARRTLVFTDPRQFGRITYHTGQQPPEWWTRIPPPLTSDHFTIERLEAILHRRARLPIKAALLLQDAFPGVGNWMADEILWRTRLHPRQPCGRIPRQTVPGLWRTIRWVCRRALETVGVDFSDPPRGWLFHERWSGQGTCPRHHVALRRETVGGRTTAWCARCQGE